MATESLPADRELFWASLRTRYEVRLRRYLQRARCIDEELEDGLADTWVEALLVEQRLRCSSDQWSELHLIVRRIAASRVRDRRHQVRLAGEFATVDPLSTSPDCASSESEADPWPRIECALGELSDNQQSAVEFRFLWGWPYWAIAAALSIGEATARVHVRNGLKRLRELTLSGSASER